MKQHLVTWATAFVVVWWTWLLLAGEWNRTEWVAAAIAAALASSLTTIARARARIVPRLSLRWVGRSASVPPAVFVDFAVIVWALAAGLASRSLPTGRFRAHEHEGARDAAARWWLALAATYSPNAYVVDIDDQRGLVLLHDLVPRRSSESPA